MCRQAKQAKKFQVVLVLPSQILIHILFYRRAKQVKKFQIELVLPSQILIYYCVDKQSKLKIFKCY